MSNEAPRSKKWLEQVRDGRIWSLGELDEITPFDANSVNDNSKLPAAVPQPSDAPVRDLCG